jgi:hypothetical protein
VPRPTTRCLFTTAVLVAAFAAACSDDGGGNLEAFCETARRLEVDNPANALAAYDPADPAGAARLLRDAAGALDAWSSEAPGDIRNDVERLRDAAGDLAEAFEAPTVDATRVADLEAGFDEVEAAGTRVVESVRSECSVDLEPPTTTATTG